MPRPSIVLALLIACDEARPPEDAAGPVRDAEPEIDSALDGGTDVGPVLDGSTSAEPDPSCAANGCLRAATKVGDFPKSVLEPLLAPDVQIDHGYSVWSISYSTSGRLDQATVTIPLAEVPPGGWSSIVNAHGTSGVADACALTGTPLGAGLAGTFGARGFVGVAPDYPGLGTEGPHPYLIAEVEGRALLDAARATETLLAWQRIASSRRVAVVGLSQGGHAALSAAREHAAYAPELDVRAFAAAAPASVWEEHWRAGVAIDGPHQAFHALMAYAWATYADLDAPVLLDGVAAHLESTCVAGTSPTLFEALGPSAAAIFAPDFLDAYRSGTWGVYAPFGALFAENRVGPYEQTAPLLIYQGDADTVVLESGTRAVVDALRAGGVEVEYEVVPLGTHTNVAFGFVATMELRTEASLAWLSEKLGS